MKKMMIILCLLTFLLSLTSCRGGGNDTNHSKTDLTLLDEGWLRCSSDKGYYYISQDALPLKDGTYAYRMMYIDYGTKEELYLCNRPGCSHDTVDCPAVFTDTELRISGSLFYYQNHLYLFAHDPDQTGSTITGSSSLPDAMDDNGDSFKASTASLYRMNPDGTDREKVFTFEDGVSLEDRIFAAGDTLYFVSKKVSTDKLDKQTTYFKSSERKLISVNTKNWKSSAVCNLDEDLSLIGAFSNKLVYMQTVYNQELSKEAMLDEDQFIDAYKDSYSSFGVVDLNRGETKEFGKAPNDKINTYAVHGKYLYLSTEGKGKIQQIDMTTKEKKTFAETPDSCIEQVYGGAIGCSPWADGEILDNDRLYIHLDDGRIETSQLQMSSIEGPVIIRAELKDQFLILYDYDAEKDPVYPGQYNINGAKYALIDKEDFHRGKSTLQKVKLITTGLGLGE